MRANLNLNDCSGAKVSAGFHSPSVAKAIGQKSPHIKRGTELGVDVLKAIPHATLDAMVTNGRHLVLRPKPATMTIGPESTTDGQLSSLAYSCGTERVVVPAAAANKFDVVEGVKINAKPLTMKAAHKLADAAKH